MAVTRKQRVRIGVYGVLGMVVLILLLHPYGRQMIFGPRIHGQPLAYWQDRYRRIALGSGPKGPVTLKFLALIGVKDTGTFLSEDPEMLPVVFSLLDDPSPQVRAFLAGRLQQHVDTPEVSAELIRLLDDPAPTVRAAATLALVRLKPAHEPALASLRARLADDDPLCRVRAAYAVCRIEKPPSHDAVAVLRNGLTIDDSARIIQGHEPSACLEAVDYLCSLGKDNPELIADVAGAFRENPMLRRHGVMTLLRAGPIATPILVQSLGDADREIRVSAAAVLGSLGPRAEAALPALLHALDDPDLGVRKTAAQALSRISPEHYPALKVQRK